MSEKGETSMYGDVIEANYRDVRRRVDAAAKRAGRNPEEITLVAVSKTKTCDKIQKALNAGALDFGENRVQELIEKMDYFAANSATNLQNSIKWHQIGRLQKNKVKYLIGRGVMIHSVDREELACEISRLSEKNGVVTDVLLQVNISREATKGGVEPENVRNFYECVSEMKGINVKGLMAIPEKTNSIELRRKVFLEMNEIYLDIFGEKEDNSSRFYLSMGMSNDFELAIECGSNMVRVGTSIFGGRE